MLPCRFKICSQFIQITLVCKSVTKFLDLRGAAERAGLLQVAVRPAGLLAAAARLHAVSLERKFTDEPMIKRWP